MTDRTAKNEYYLQYFTNIMKSVSITHIQRERERGREGETSWVVFILLTACCVSESSYRQSSCCCTSPSLTAHRWKFYLWLTFYFVTCFTSNLSFGSSDIVTSTSSCSMIVSTSSERKKKRTTQKPLGNVISLKKKLCRSSVINNHWLDFIQNQMQILESKSWSHTKTSNRSESPSGFSMLKRCEQWMKEWRGTLLKAKKPHIDLN